MDGMWLFHLTPVVMMVTVLIINHRLNGRKHEAKSGAEASRLAAALSVELQSTLQQYTENLELLAQEAPILLSSRNGGQVYRANLGRLVALLDERALAPVVAAYAHGERIEAMLTACSQPNSHFMLRAGAGGAYHDRLRDSYRTGCEMVEAALSALALAWPIEGAADRIQGSPAMPAARRKLVTFDRRP